MHPNVTVLLEVLRAFNDGDLAALAGRVRPDVSYRIPGRAPISGEFHGVEVVIGAFARLRDRSGDMITLEPGAMVADDDHVMFTARVPASHLAPYRPRGKSFAVKEEDGGPPDLREQPGGGEETAEHKPQRTGDTP